MNSESSVYICENNNYFIGLHSRENLLTKFILTGRNKNDNFSLFRWLMFKPDFIGTETRPGQLMWIDLHL